MKRRGLLQPEVCWDPTGDPTTVPGQLVVLEVGLASSTEKEGKPQLQLRGRAALTG